MYKQCSPFATSFILINHICKNYSQGNKFEYNNNKNRLHSIFSITISTSTFYTTFTNHLQSVGCDKSRALWVDSVRSCSTNIMPFNPRAVAFPLRHYLIIHPHLSLFFSNFFIHFFCKNKKSIKMAMPPALHSTDTF